MAEIWIKIAVILLIVLIAIPFFYMLRKHALHHIERLMKRMPPLLRIGLGSVLVAGGLWMLVRLI